MTFLIMHQTIVPRDAIGQDIVVMHEVLQRHGHKSRLYGKYVDGIGPPDLVSDQMAEATISDPDVAVIYHHSLFWEWGEQLLARGRGPMFIKYHNITPPNFFANSREDWIKCAAGREQTYRFATRFPQARWLPDSKFNLAELGLDEVVYYSVVPPFIGVSVNVPPMNETLFRSLLAERRFQVLFVSRFAPNKGHLFLLQVLRDYIDRFGRDIVVYIAGTVSDQCRPYYEMVQSTASALDVSEHFRYVGQVSESDLLSYFLGSDAYLCCSEHEGFCVPLVEAQSLNLPVVARAAGAVRETAGPGQAVLGEDPAEYAATLHMIRTNPEYRRRLTAAGQRNFRSRFTAEVVASQLLSAVSDGYDNPTDAG